AALFLWWQRPVGESATAEPDRSGGVATLSRQGAGRAAPAGEVPLPLSPPRETRLQLETTRAPRSRPDGENYPGPDNASPTARPTEPRAGAASGTLPEHASADTAPGPSPVRPAPRSSGIGAAAMDPVVRSILFSPGRRVALIDSRIVTIGDEISAGRIVAIEPDAVVVETPDGNRRRLGLRSALPVTRGR